MITFQKGNCDERPSQMWLRPNNIKKISEKLLVPYYYIKLSSSNFIVNVSY